MSITIGDISNIRSEFEIKKDWIDEAVKVSISCITYNHENYIHDTLAGFLNQETSFAFEILVHDDASTDRTADIILEYQKLYPSIIKPILQQVNQHSQGIKISSTYNYPRAKGVFIAICEGDDYWIDPFKLQKQVEYLESHPKCTFSFTNAIVDFNNGKRYRSNVVVPWTAYAKSKFKTEKSIYYLPDLTEILGYIPTASFLTRREILLDKPHLPSNCFSGDQYTALYCVSRGYAYFINENTCAYRINVPDSATARWRKIGNKKYTIHPVNKKFLAISMKSVVF